METLVFPDGKALLIAWLKQLTGLTVASAVPKTRPDEFIKVQDAGMQRVDRHVRELSFTLEFWAKATTRAYGIGAAVLAYFESVDALDGVTVYRPRDWGPPVELPDESGQPRYTATVSFRLKSSPLSGAFFMPENGR